MNVRQSLFRLLQRDPLVPFALAGGACFLLYWGLNGNREPIMVTQSVQASLAEEYEMLHGEKPTPEEQQALIDRFVGDELLFREAVAQGLHLADKEVKRRLIDRMRFLVAGALPEPTEADLIEYYAENTAIYVAEPRTSFSHVFFEKAPADDQAVLAALNAGRAVSGDEFWMGRDLKSLGDSMVRVMFGQPFLERLKTLPEGQWAGPVASSRGVHFVRVDGREEGRRMPYAEVRDQVLRDWRADRTNALLASHIGKLKADYDVEIER